MACCLYVQYCHFGLSRSCSVCLAADGSFVVVVCLRLKLSVVVLSVTLQDDNGLSRSYSVCLAGDGRFCMLRIKVVCCVACCLLLCSKDYKCIYNLCL